MAANRTLEDLLRLASRIAPGLRGAVVDGQGRPRPCAGQLTTNAATYPRPAPCGLNHAAIEALLAHWTMAYPEAGRAYWSLRCWGILIWQPIYLSVIGVHAARCKVSLERFEQPIGNGWTREVRIPAHVPTQGDSATLIDLAACEIAACCVQIYAELARVIRLNVHAARGIQADCVLAALLAVRATCPE